ncbi:hypothetical protein RND61_30870 [Streptomyces sp. TRM76323]|uniref:Uncharacterized protein n=1 Tax=Streptomyces tamarix TaxID=3078565 RepID=A0ABU3QUL6_9ACTN|nr:hypothetical protein [Streptomyces tamarix]MDT9686442.1 hypothetical protein [Streptomyces tamarix]
MDATPPGQLRPPAAPDPADPPAPPPAAPGADGGAPAGGDGGGAGGPLPLGVARTATGYGPVDAVLERLGDADHLAADGHLEVYEDVHRGLRDALAALDADPRPGPPNDHRS